MGRGKRDYSLDILRIIACVMVVGVHTAAEGWYSISPRTYTWTVLNFYDTLCRPTIPLFIMISGSLFLTRNKIDIKRLWLKNVFRIVRVYFIWIVFYAVTATGVKKTMADPKTVWSIISGPNPQYHLWYMRTLINVYAVAPLLWLLVRSMDKRHFRYFCILFFIFGLLRKTVFDLPFIPVWLHDQISLFEEMDLVGYAGYFMLGYFFTVSDPFERIPDVLLGAVYLITLILAAGLNQWIAVIDDWPTQALYGSFSIPVAIEAFCIFILVRRKWTGRKVSPFASKCLPVISGSTFFVYLIHPFVIKRLQIYFGLYTTNYNVLISVPVMVLLVFLLSLAAGIVLERVPGLKRIL